MLIAHEVIVLVTEDGRGCAGLPLSCVFVLCAHRDQVYLVSLRESYRNEIIPYRVRNLHKHTYTHTHTLWL